MRDVVGFSRPLIEVSDCKFISEVGSRIFLHELFSPVFQVLFSGIVERSDDEIGVRFLEILAALVPVGVEDDSSILQVNNILLISSHVTEG